MFESSISSNYGLVLAVTESSDFAKRPLCSKFLHLFTSDTYLLRWTKTNERTASKNFSALSSGLSVEMRYVKGKVERI